MMNMLKLIKNANPLLIQVGCSKDDEVGRLHVCISSVRGRKDFCPWPGMIGTKQKNADVHRLQGHLGSCANHFMECAQSGFYHKANFVFV